MNDELVMDTLIVLAFLVDVFNVEILRLMAEILLAETLPLNLLDVINDVFMSVIDIKLAMIELEFTSLVFTSKASK